MLDNQSTGIYLVFLKLEEWLAVLLIVSIRVLSKYSYACMKNKLINFRKKLIGTCSVGVYVYEFVNLQINMLKTILMQNNHKAKN